MTGLDLKPCPFCGEKMPDHDDTSYIRCMGCGAESGWRATPEDVAAAWNRRDPAVLAALPEVQALIAAAYEVAAKRMDAGFSYNAGNAIRALTPADATAALAARDAAMIARGMREAATLLREQGYGTAPKQILARAAEIEGDSTNGGR